MSDETTPQALSPAEAAVVDETVKQIYTLLEEVPHDHDPTTDCERCLGRIRARANPLIALVVAARGQSARERQERLRASGTHWDGCETVHLDCAVEALVAARAETAEAERERNAYREEALNLGDIIYGPSDEGANGGLKGALATAEREREQQTRKGWLLLDKHGTPIRIFLTRSEAVERTGLFPDESYREVGVVDTVAALRAAGGGDGK